MKFLLSCPTTYDRSGCDPDISGGCCARSVLATQLDFLQQRGRLEEELEAAHQLVIFYPKFHCELNFIERFWCASKWYARENCEYSLKDHGKFYLLPLTLYLQQLSTTITIIVGR